MGQTRPRRNWKRIALIGAFALSLTGNALAIGAAWRLSAAREELFGPAAEQAVFDRATRRALREAFGAETDRLRPQLHALAAARAAVVRAGAARPFDAAARADLAPEARGRKSGGCIGSSDRKVGAPGEIRTPDHLVRSQVLYPAELRAHVSEPEASPGTPFTVKKRGGGERGIRTLDGAFNPILP